MTRQLQHPAAQQPELNERRFALRGDNWEFWENTAPECLIFGSADCIDGDTVIEGDGRMIRWLAEHGVAPVVQTLSGPKQAGVPFLKGMGWLYEVQMEDGRSFKATAKHIVLTEQGFSFISSLTPGSMLRSYAACLCRTRIATIKRVKYDNFYDLTVPDAHHYFAGGFIHHNSGKTWTGMLKLHAACSNYPKMQCLLLRKTYHSLAATAVKTFLRVTEGQGVRPYGGETPTRFIYPNGSEIWLGGLDNAESFLSGEFAVAYVNQAEALTQDEWEMVGMRCTGRGTSFPHPQIIGDGNPGSRRHWILDRAASGKLRLLRATHLDNPELYNTDGTPTPEGVKRMARLRENLSGVRFQRYFLGVWATSEGVVFDAWNPDTHVRHRDDSEFNEWFLCQDEGYTNPATILLVGKDSDGRWHVAREFYKRGVAEVDVVAVAAEWNREKLCTLDAYDAAGAGLGAALVNAGVNAIGGKGRLLDGILHCRTG